jgi:hypothetical protein
MWAVAPFPLLAVLAVALGFVPPGHGFHEPLFILLMLLATFVAIYWAFWALL